MAAILRRKNENSDHWVAQIQEFVFVFEEDLICLNVMEKVKQQLFDVKVGKDVAQAREVLNQKPKLTTRMKRQSASKTRRPPKQQVKIEIEPQLTGDITQLFLRSAACSYIFQISALLLQSRSLPDMEQKPNCLQFTWNDTCKVDTKLEALSQRLESLRQLSGRLSGIEDIVGERDQKLFKAVAQNEPIVSLYWWRNSKETGSPRCGQGLLAAA